MRTSTSNLSRVVGYAALAALAIAVAVTPGIAKQKKSKQKLQVIERFSARAMNIDVGAASMIEMAIMGWTTEQERQALVQAFNDGGNEGAYKYLGKQEEKAFMNLPNSMGYRMRYAFQFNSEGKRQVVLATDRPIAMGEVMSGSQSQRDNITLVVLELDPKTNKGTGEMVVGAEFKINKKTGQLELETMSNNPTKFTSVTPGKVKKKKQ